ncbi:hypothetical protein EXIGLDRAFT_761415 [Exidia glandulosa HHB12029]|uniref:Uncharacterized protein n=1 Tax=Exidia glandulosa HHB12029 TaxID=1314781 RepID=A0A165NK99_EXIGL|nr:hypothetical protein EXIGLDRAFT_761415 [Exidia glandulosa HHB12029]
MPDLDATAFGFSDDLVPAAYKLPRPSDSGDEYDGEGRQDSLSAGTRLRTRPRAQTGSSRDEPVEVQESDSEDAAACGSSDSESSLEQPSTPTTLSRESGDDRDRFLSDAESYSSDSTDDSDEVEPPSPEAVEDLQELQEEIQSRDETILFLLARGETIGQPASRGVRPSAATAAYHRATCAVKKTAELWIIFLRL